MPVRLPRKEFFLLPILLVATVFITACPSGSSGGNPNPATTPTITTQPTDQTANAGVAATFTVAANGTMPLTYQWKKGGVNVGTNSTTYTTAPTTAADDQAQVMVTVSNSAGSVTSNTVTLTVHSPPVITTQPAGRSVPVGQTATFSVVAIGSLPLSYQWQKNGINVGTNSSSYTTPPTLITDNASTIMVTVTNAFGNTTSSPATLTVTLASTVNVLTYHNDNARTGQNLSETILAPSNVQSATFGKKGTLPVVGLVDAEPLYVSNLTVAGNPHNVVFVATEHDMAYAFDADSFAQLWAVSVAPANEGPSDNRGCGQVTPEIGVTSTPVIDLTAGAHGTMFLVAMTKDNGGAYHHRLHALDITTGAEIGTPTLIQATFPGNGTGSSGGQMTFDAKMYKDRAALLLLNGVIYTSWASHCDFSNYNGWLMGYSESTLLQVSKLNITPNAAAQGGKNGAIWMAGAGPAADSSGNFYFLDGNGTFDDTLDGNGLPINQDYGNAFVKVSTANSTMTVADYFNMFNTDSESSADTDLGSGGAMVLPDLQDNLQNTWHLAVGAGKDTNLYVVNRDPGMMGKFSTQNDNAIYQKLSGALPGGVWAAPVYFNNAVYYGAQGSTLKAFTIANAKLSAGTHTSNSFGYPGTTPSVSASGNSNGIVWAIENGSTGVLHAYDASNLGTELYNSNQAGSRDQFPTNSNNKFVTPMIANGKVFVGTPNAVVVFGPLP